MTQAIGHWSFELYKPTMQSIKSLIMNKYGFSFITKKLYNDNMQVFNDEGTFILFHLDRF
jgi:hypothetical protein